MLNRRHALTAIAATTLFLAGPALAVGAQGPKIGAPAPSFSATNADGKPVSLADYKGKTVVLEWTNDECPFVRKHYEGKNMQALQKKWTGKDVVWLTIISSPPGEQGYADAAKANKLTADRSAAPTAVVLDPKGDVGRAFKAQVTPHMYIIKGDGTLAYMGGIDDKPSARIEDLKGAKNYVDVALQEIADGKAVSTPTSRPYGCTVKFTS
ncbi:redoxin domain-containing protein [Enterovirga rhinocerotis]|uniref:Peroxiredoxin n=1 Tax=Enterovirga rhinocerotis TaxID=1339210 RepID=A0A4V3DZ19_9HYPH|nr:redoxin domain-containing protein [Enterovirga rhinocerotis]TDR94819.1 peroxiredoxin [Enterovirga rhinocerotis]